jgi:hypothetical protein
MFEAIAEAVVISTAKTVGVMAGIAIGAAAATLVGALAGPQIRKAFGQSPESIEAQASQSRRAA